MSNENSNNQQTECQKNESKETEKTKHHREWIEWRKAKKEGRLTEHRRMLKREANRNEQTRQR